MADRVLVTGGTGFTGGHLCRRLAGNGVSVRALVRDRARCRELSELGVELVVGDLRDRESLIEAVRGVETVYHIAALFREENVSRAEVWATNVEGTRAMLDAAIDAGVKRFVHCSTVGVHGHIENPPASEESPYSPGDPYQESKTEGEQIVLRYGAEGLLPVVVFRPGGIYGPGDLRFRKLFKAIRSRTFVMLGSGEVLYQLIYIDDLIDGILLCGTRPEAVGQTFILTGETPLTLNRLAAEIAEALDVAPPRLRLPVTPVYLLGHLCELTFKPLGLQPPIYRRRVDFFRKDRAFSIAKAKEKLGFQPKVDVKRGLRATAGWYEAQGLL
jgi:nucleoside-diphosphate-sugar epimerase